MARETAKEKRERREREEALNAEIGGERAAEQQRERTEAIEALNKNATLHPDQVPSAHGERMKTGSAGAKVVVGCKLGIQGITLQLSKLEEKWENTQTGPRKIREPVRYGPLVYIRGTAYPRGTPPIGFPAPPVIVDGAALTFDVDKDFWDAWVEQHKLDPLVINGMIFAHENRDHVIGQARETKAIVSGLDPVNPRGDPRVSKSTRADLTNVETEESRAKAMERLNLP